jgi:molybdate transport system ATP-binding protein
MTHARFTKKDSLGFCLDIDFPITPGITALYGPPGSGKTLLLDTIAGFSTPDSGRILLDDTILFDAQSRVNVPPRRRNCGYIFQQDALFPHLTVRQNLVFPAKRWPRLERHRRVSEMLDRFQLKEAASARPHEVTAAERLRCSIARALIAEPKLLLIDDRSLDEQLVLQVRQAFPAPILLVAGDLDLCRAVADQLVILDAGRIAQRGAPRDVLDAPASVEVARLLGIPNVFQGSIAALDPGRNSSRLEFDGYALTAPYIRGHFRGDRIWIAVAAADLRVHSESRPDCVSVQLLRASHRTRSVRLEFSHGIFADLSPEEFAGRRDNKDWWVEFPPEAIRIL